MEIFRSLPRQSFRRIEQIPDAQKQNRLLRQARSLSRQIVFENKFKGWSFQI